MCIYIYIARNPICIYMVENIYIYIFIYSFIYLYTCFIFKVHLYIHIYIYVWYPIYIYITLKRTTLEVQVDPLHCPTRK